MKADHRTFWEMLIVLISCRIDPYNNKERERAETEDLLIELTEKASMFLMNINANCEVWRNGDAVDRSTKTDRRWRRLCLNM